MAELPEDCALGEDVSTDYGLRIAALFAIMTASFIGGILPLITRHAKTGHHPGQPNPIEMPTAPATPPIQPASRTATDDLILTRLRVSVFNDIRKLSSVLILRFIFVPIVVAFTSHPTPPSSKLGTVLQSGRADSTRLQTPKTGEL